MKRYMKRAAALLLGGAMVLVYRLLSNGVSRLHSTRDLQTMSLFIHFSICETYSTLSLWGDVFYEFNAVRFEAVPNFV